MNYFVHHSSIIDENVIIGANSKIWHFCHILSGSEIGESCVLGQNCMIGANVKLGNGVKVQNNVSIFEGVKIEDSVFIGPSVVFTNVLTPRAFISRKNAFVSTIVRQGASIGANATIVCGVEIGAFSLIGAGSVVTKNVAPFALVVGNPARQVGFVDKAGKKLVFKDNIAKDSFDDSLYRLCGEKIEILKG